MKKSKRLIAFILSLILALQGSMTVQAAGEGGVGANAGHQGNTAAGYTSSSGNGTWRLPTNIGIRFTVTDNQGHIVGTVLGKKGSLDVVNSGFKETGKLMTGCATEPIETELNKMTYTDFMSAINKGTKQMPDWITSDEATHGAEHRAWMIQGVGGTGGGSGVITGDSEQNVSLSTTARVTTSKATNADNKRKTDAAAANGGIDVLAHMMDVSDDYVKPGGSSSSFDAERARESYRKKQEALEQQTQKKPALLSYLELQFQQASQKSNAAPKEKPPQRGTMSWLPPELLDPFMLTSYAGGPGGSSGPGGSTGGLDDLGTIGNNFKDKFNDEISDIKDGAVDEGTGSAVASDYNPDEVGYAWAVLNLVKNNQYVFQLPGGATTFSENDAANKVRPGDIFIKNDYRLVVENTIQGIPQHWTKKGAGANYSGGYVYGTAHNWAVFGATDWTRDGGNNSFGNHQRYLTRPLPRAFVTEQDWPGVLSVPPDDDQWKIDEMIQRITTGFGTHVYYPADLPGNPNRNPSSSTNEIRTWDKPNFPDVYGPTEWPKDVPEDDSYKEKNNSNTLKISKYYQFVDVKGNVYPLEFFNTTNAPHRVYIMDEVEGNGFKLTDWFESKDDWQPPEDSLPEDHPYSQVKKQHFNTGITGTEEKLPHVIPADTQTKVLHILLEYTGKPEPEKVTVIRVYDRDEEGNTEKIETEEIPQGPGEYPVPIDPEYKYVETKESPNPPKETHTWEDSEGTPEGTPPTVKYPETTKTIYIHYVKPPKSPDTQKIVLYENELSYNYSLKDLLKDRKLIEVYDNVPAAPFVWASCPGHTIIVGYDSDDDPIYRTFYCHTKTKGMNDMDWTVSVKDTFDQNTLPFIKQWTYVSEMSATGITNGNGGEGRRAIVRPNATFLVIRDKQKDVVTLYPGKNDGIKGELSDLNLTEGYTSTDTRYKNKRETNATEKFYNTIRTQLDDSGSERNLEWWTILSGTYGSHGKTGGYNTSPEGGHSVSDANAAYSKTDNFETRYFLGKAGKSEEEPKDTRSAWTKKFKYNIAYSRTSAGLSFYPYLKYSYYRKDSRSPEPVMVTSSNLSEFKVYNAIQTGVYKKNEININLDSTQWSTHARSMSFLKNAGVSDKKSVLPGGAIQNLDSGNKGDTQIGLTIWQTCLPDNQVQAVQEGFKVSETEAKEATNNLIESVKKAISGYGLVQWGQKGVYTDMKSLLSVAEELHENKKISFVSGRGGKTSADDKYYLRHDGEGSNRANFDCLDSRIENQYLYTIYSDTDGNVWVTKDGAELGRISKTQDVSGLLSNAELKLLDDNTKLITNYVAVIQRNSGTTRHGEKWHNEAFDGVSVLMTDVSFDVGYGGDSAKRTNVLDPLLTAPTQSKSDLYNFSDEDLVRSSVYVTTKTSSQAEQQKEGFLGILKGVSGMPDLETGLRDIQSMAYTKNFYIPNATVSDLN